MIEIPKGINSRSNQMTFFLQKTSIGKTNDTNLKKLEKKYLYANGVFLKSTSLITKIALRFM